MEYPLESTDIARESLPGLVPGSPIVSRGDKFQYQGIVSSKLGCSDEVRVTPSFPEERNEGWRSLFRYSEFAVDNLTATEYMIDDGNESSITMDEIIKAIKHMNVRKSAGYDRISSEMLRGGGDVVASLLYQLFKKC
ncbi:hypothetical protein EVAR_83034_1 [Eumeta japonica]|uniref:Uncharacterized protein n=1 Tax=Eumeta variegata TaxID=151549 RepID=A0A4C1VP09_EUMVA|nr:hypothetical protein EVAR_83034_1 [Eumeta japonica]